MGESSSLKNLSSENLLSGEVPNERIFRWKNLPIGEISSKVISRQEIFWLEDSPLAKILCLLRILPN